MTGPRLSIIPATAAFDPAISAPMYRLLGVLAARADKQGRCWPSISKIAKDMHTSERWVHKTLRRLLKTPYLSATFRPGHSSVYQIKGVNSGFTPEPEVHPCPPGSPTPEPEVHPPLNQRFTQKDTKKDTNHTGGLFERFWAAYPKRTPHANPKKPALQKFLAVLKEGEDAEAIIRGAENYAVYIRQEGKEPRYVAQATKFLEQEYWTGYQTRPKPVFKAVL